MNETTKPNKLWNPYLGGVALGLVLLTALVLTGKGLGASGGVGRVGVATINTLAPSHVDANAAMKKTKAGGRSPLDSWFVFMLLGVALGGFVSSYTAGRFGREVVRGPRISVNARLAFAFSGGILMGIGAKMARGCTSGQALTGGALLSVGSWIFMMAVFAGGYGLAYFMRRQWT